MPIYEYHCECGKEREVKLFFKDANQPQICECGKTMRRKMSAPNFAIKPTGNQMALDTLNSGVVGGKRKAWAEQNAAKGLESPPKTVW
jgi:putative FmdB family regulatory protein